MRLRLKNFHGKVKSEVNNKEKKKTGLNIWKWLTLGWASYALFLIFGIFLLLPWVTLDFYPRIVGAEDYRSIYDWDYPSEGRGDFNNDGIEDRMTSGGCANFGPQSERPPLMCEPYYVSGNRTIERGGEYPYHSYMVKEGGKWFILVLDRNEELKKYSIAQDKEIQLVSPNRRDYFNEAIYYIPMITMNTLLVPTQLLSPVVTGRGAALIYFVILLFFIYRWQKT